MRIIIITKANPYCQYMLMTLLLAHTCSLDSFKLPGKSLWGRHSYHVHFTDEDMEAYRGDPTHTTGERPSQYINPGSLTLGPSDLHHLSREKERPEKTTTSPVRMLSGKILVTSHGLLWGGLWERALPVLVLKIVKFSPEHLACFCFRTLGAINDQLPFLSWLLRSWEPNLWPDHMLVVQGFKGWVFLSFPSSSSVSTFLSFFLFSLKDKTLRDWK